MVSALVIEDDRTLRRVLVKLLSRLGLDVREAGTLLEGERALEEAPDLVLLDLHLPDGEGGTILEHCRGRQPWTPVVVVSGADDLESTVQALRRGAFDYLVKPLDLQEIVATVDRVLLELRFRADLEPTPSRPTPAAGLVGRSAQMRDLYKQIATVGPSDIDVLISGETGVGKELVARAIHAASKRAAAPFVAINCATLSTELLASELFGHVRGAFTGAVVDRVGRFESVADGTLFLDEVGELAGDIQAKLLRVLQERTFERVGDDTPRRFTGRILSATNRDLAHEMRRGAFRADLYYRLSTIEVAVPPLRTRKSDIPLLVAGLTAHVAREADVTPLVVPDPIVAELGAYDWPGNVRELRNVLQRMTVLARGQVATKELLARSGFGQSRCEPSRPGPLDTLAALEAEHIARVLDATDWQKARSARILGISRPTLDRKIKEHGLSPAAPCPEDN